MAAAMFRAKLKTVREDWADWQIDSAGTWARNGDPAAYYSEQVMQQRGLDITNHRSKIVTLELLRQYDLILVMEAGHKEGLQIEFPEVARRVFMMSEMLGVVYPVKDPAGQNLPAYEATAVALQKIFDKGIDAIIARVMARHADPLNQAK